MSPEREDELIKAVMSEDDSCTHNFAPLFALVEEWLLDAVSDERVRVAVGEGSQVARAYEAGKVAGAAEMGKALGLLADDWEQDQSSAILGHGLRVAADELRIIVKKNLPTEG